MDPNFTNHEIVTENKENKENKLFRISLTEINKIKGQQILKTVANKLIEPQLICNYCNNKYKFDMVNEICLNCNRSVYNRKPKRDNMDERLKEEIEDRRQNKQFQFFKTSVVKVINKEKVKTKNVKEVSCDAAVLEAHHSSPSSSNIKIKFEKKVSFSDELGKNLVEFIPKKPHQSSKRVEDKVDSSQEQNCKCIFM